MRDAVWLASMTRWVLLCHAFDRNIAVAVGWLGRGLKKSAPIVILKTSVSGS